MSGVLRFSRYDIIIIIIIIIIIMKVRNFQPRILTIEEFNYVQYSVLRACEILLSSFLFNLCFQRGQFLKQKYLLSFT